MSSAAVNSPQPEPVATRGSANRGPTDERGITLQTLIVTAVLVLMAVAAGVVIVAITGSASDDLEESGTDVQARCNEVEIYDPVLASRNEPGSQFDVGGDEAVSARIGCIPVCIWVNNDGGPGNLALEAGEVKFARSTEGTKVIFIRNLVPDGRREYLLASGSEGNIVIYGKETSNSPVVPRRDVHPDDDKIEMDLGPKVVRVAVAPNQKECHTYDAGGNVLLGD